MAKRRSSFKMEDAEGDMTPMIDCVFLLLIFFMLITEITQAQLELLQLPQASMAKEDDDPPEDRLVVNIVKLNDDPSDRRGEIIIERKVFDLPSPELTNVLREWAEKKRSDSVNAGDTDDRVSDIPVLIRCDRRVQYHMFQSLVRLMVDPNAKIFLVKVQIAISNTPPDLNLG